MRSKQNEEFVYQAVLAGDLEISPTGKVWRIRKRGWDRWKKQAVSRPCKRARAEHDCGEYLQVRIMLDGVRVYALAHRLVWLHLKGQIPPGLTVNHKDGMKKRNHPSNLELATHSEQQLHAVRVLKVGHAVAQGGTLNSMAKLTEQDVAKIRARRAAGERLLPLAASFNVSFQAVSKICRGERWALSG